MQQGQEYEAALTGDDIKNATAGIDSDNGNDNVVQLVFTDAGAQKFADVTSANVGKIVYIIYDNKVVSAPTVQSAITGGSAEINKIGSYEEAEQLAHIVQHSRHSNLVYEFLITAQLPRQLRCQYTHTHSMAHRIIHIN